MLRTMVKNSKQLNRILNEIYDNFVYNEMPKSEILRYKKEFSKEPDYNIAQYGNLLVYSYQVDDLLTGWRRIRGYSDSAKWEEYKWLVRRVAEYIIKDSEYPDFE